MDAKVSGTNGNQNVPPPRCYFEDQMADEANLYERFLVSVVPDSTFSEGSDEGSSVAGSVDERMHYEMIETVKHRQRIALKWSYRGIIIALALSLALLWFGVSTLIKSNVVWADGTLASTLAAILVGHVSLAVGCLQLNYTQSRLRNLGNLCLFYLVITIVSALPLSHSSTRLNLGIVFVLHIIPSGFLYLARALLKRRVVIEDPRPRETSPLVH